MRGVNCKVHNDWVLIGFEFLQDQNQNRNAREMEPARKQKVHVSHKAKQKADLPVLPTSPIS
jgi:hypothetical protein